MNMNSNIDPRNDTHLEVIDGWRIYAARYTAQLYLRGKNFFIFINGQEATTRLLLALYQGVEKIEFSEACESESLTIHYGQGEVLSLVNFSVDEDTYEIFQEHKPGHCIVSPHIIIQYGHPAIVEDDLPSGWVLQVLQLRG